MNYLKAFATGFLCVLVIGMFGIAAEDAKKTDKPEPKTKDGFSYVVDGKSYHVQLKPYDKESEALIKKYRITTFETSVGVIMMAMDGQGARDNNVRPIITMESILVREGFSEIEQKDFTELFKKASQFDDIRGQVTDANRTQMIDQFQQFLGRQDWIRPVMEGTEWVEGKLLLHNSVKTYWESQK